MRAYQAALGIEARLTPRSRRFVSVVHAHVPTHRTPLSSRRELPVHSPDVTRPPNSAPPEARLTNVVERLTLALADRYNIDREIGAGGMATVYLAHDVRHDRKVALKVLRPELSAILGAERFLKEIRLTANLQHPHILPLHDSGEADGTVFYVMPYVEGESLRDRLLREKQLPVDDAVRIATEVAGALDYAHRHHVVHRDIKPENILLHDGQALVADFGIALAVSTVGGGTRMTETGMSLGTPHYMAPEQAMGDREITPRADIYALGCVLYEMLTGDPPFTGSTAQAIVARVVTETPRPMHAQRHTIPAHVEAATLTALEKLPADRFTTAAEFVAALGNRGFTSTAFTGTALAEGLPGARPSRLARWMPWAAAAAAVVIAALALTRPEPPRPVIRYGLALPAQQVGRADRAFAISPDGARIVYVGPSANGIQLWVKERDRYEATPLAGTEAVLNFTFSPDGQWIAFGQRGELRKMPVLGGAAITLTNDISGNPGIAWLDDGTIVYVRVGGAELRRIPDIGGNSTVILPADSTTGVIHPAALPGSRGVLYVRCRATGCAAEQDLYVLDFRSGQSRLVQNGVVTARFARPEHLVYVRRDGGLFGLGFNPRSLKTEGAPTPLLDSISVVNGLLALFSLSDDGTLITRPGSALSSRVFFTMVAMDREGRETVLDTSWTFRHAQSGANAGWSVSPDGRRIAIGIATDEGDDIWVKQLPRGPLSRITFDSLPEFRPRWTPDGRSILYGSFVGANVMRTRADGTGEAELVLDLNTGIYEFAMSPDANWLLYRTGGTVAQVGGRNVFARRWSGDTTPVPLVASPVFDEAAFALSPDGRWIAYEANETGRREVYVRPFPNTNESKWQISNGGGVAPLWSRNGRELYFVNANREMVVTPLLAGAAFEPREQRVLFRLRDDIYLEEGENYTPFDIGSDGRFVMARRVRAEVGQVAPMIVAENWFTEMRQKLRRR